jgi:hypothetical protein
LFWWKECFSTIFTKFRVSWGTFWILKKCTVVPPMIDLSPKFLLKTCFCQSIVIILMKGMLFDNFQKVWSRLGHFLNLKKNLLWSPFVVDPGVAVVFPPLFIWPTFLQTCFDQLKVIVLMKGMLFDNIRKVLITLDYFLNFLKKILWSPFVDPGVACSPPYAFENNC